MARMISIILYFLFHVLSANALDNGLGRLPPLGWNTWCTLGPCGRDYCDEQEVRPMEDFNKQLLFRRDYSSSINQIKEMADIIVSTGLKDLGFEYINLDDCTWSV